jgi:hypothetical protein
VRYYVGRIKEKYDGFEFDSTFLVSTDKDIDEAMEEIAKDFRGGDDSFIISVDGVVPITKALFDSMKEVGIFGVL